ncbi:hypothetical protein GCM10017559_70470 [Streptosporangium longisporum]|uniref:FXSXX-COOH protein n=1 Tax=Streptosporangium longisporum TaxID=46187 RepID=A0ABP6L552_9ACTN
MGEGTARGAAVFPGSVPVQPAVTAAARTAPVNTIRGLRTPGNVTEMTPEVQRLARVASTIRQMPRRRDVAGAGY